jgi:outer membrane immunogenic protein
LPVYTKAPAVVAAPVYNWTGCYVGGNIGWNGSHNDDLLAPTGAYLNPPGAAAPPNAAGTGALPGDLAAVTHSYVSSNSAVTGGVQIGCNIQKGAFVFGGEADFNGSGSKNSINSAFGPVPSSNPVFTISPETDAVTAKMDWFSTVRGRIGYAFDRVLVYATGGVVIADVSSTTSVDFSTAGTSPVYSGAQHLGNASTTKVAGVVGAGVEYAINDKWSMKAEYLYFDLGDFGYTSPLIASAGVAPGYAWRTNADLREQVVRVGINYHFNWSGPVVAKY